MLHVSCCAFVLLDTIRIAHPQIAGDAKSVFARDAKKPLA